MRLALVTGTVEATVKDASLTGSTLLVVDLVDGGGAVLSSAHVAVDSVGAGVGDTVLLTRGSAARMPSGAAGQPVDLSIIAIVDRVTLSKSSSSSRRKS
jgi:carbon dioxide concentrating mechanism protein CcmL